MATATTFRTHAAARPRIARRDVGRSRARVALVRATSDPSSASYDRVVDAIVIGGSSGMGKAAAREVVKRGGKVLIGSRSREKLDAAAADIASSLGLDPADAEARVRVAVVDNTDETSVRNFFADVPPGEYNGMVVSAAARSVHGAFLDLDVADVRAFVDSKFWGAYHCAKHGAPRLADGGGVVLFSGVLSRRPGVNCSPLAVCNGAIEGLVRSLALELGPRLRVNCFSPGFVDTERFDHMPPERREAMLASTASSLPLERVGAPEDAGLALHFLMQSAYTTGAILDCDGGHQVRQYATREGDPMRAK